MEFNEDGVERLEVPGQRGAWIGRWLRSAAAGEWEQLLDRSDTCRASESTGQPAGFLLVLSTAFPEPIIPPLSAIQLQPLERINGSPVLAEAMAKAEAAHATQDQQQRHLVGRRRRIARLAQHGHQR